MLLFFFLQYLLVLKLYTINGISICSWCSSWTCHCGCADALKFPCTGADYEVAEGISLAGANVNCASGECQLEKGELAPAYVSAFQNAIFLSVTTTTEPYTLQTGRYIFFVNC
jgi:hypothetical protein